VGGGILVHGFAPLGHAIEGALQGLGGLAGALLPALASGLFGVAAGALVLAGVTLARRLFGRAPA
jgi:predicted DNA repair protein MutK